MTVPVIQETVEETRKMAFIVPEKFGEDIPQPNDPSLKVEKFEGGLFAAIRYSGFSNKTKELKMSKKLEEWILKINYEKQSNYIFASYNAPFVPPMMRRNEVWIRVVKA